MVEDAAQAYNPIIQAMIATANLQKQGQQQEIEKERNKQEAAARAETAKNELLRIKNEHEYQQSHIELMGKANSLAAEAQHMQTAAMLRDLAAKGVDVGKLGLSGLFTGGLTHGADPQQQSNTPPGVLPQGAAPISNATPVAGFTPVTPPQQNGGTPDFSSAFPGPAQEAARLQGIAKAESQGKAEGALPSEEKLASQRYGYESNLQQAARDSAEKIATLGRVSAERIAGLSRGTELAIANMHNKTQLTVAGMGGDAQSQNLVKSLMMGAATGEIKLNPANPLERVAYSGLQQNGFQTIDPKQVQEAKSMETIRPLLDKLDKLASQLPESTAGAALKGATEGAINTFTTSKLRNDINIINSQIMNVAKTTEGVTGRPLAAAMKSELDALAGVTTKSNMQERVQNLRDNFVNKLNNVIFAGVPDAQRELLDKKYGIKPLNQPKPDWLRLAPQKSKIGGTLDEDASLKIGKPVYR